MASDKKPSIYSDRSTIGSSDELDEYGVWVKSDPQDFSSSNAGNADKRADAASSLPDFDSGLGDESADSELGNLDLPDLEVPDDNMVIAEETDTFDSLESDTLGTPDDTSLEEASFDDFSIPEDDAVMKANIDLEDSIGLDDSIDEDSAALDDSISLDESIDLEGSIGLDDGIDLEADADLEDIGFEDSISRDESIDFDDGTGLDDIGVEDGINLDESIDLEGGAGLDDSIGLDESTDLEDSIDLDFPLVEDEPAEDSVFDSGEETPFENVGFTEVVMDDFPEESPVELPAAGAAHIQAPAQAHIQAPAQAHTQAPAQAHTQAPAQAHVQSDLSTQLLMKIAEELSSIRTELTSLKKEFASIKAEVSTEEKEKAETQHGGFFNEEEDEKIALTGDELDNILTTADFTEEAGEDATEELEGEFSFSEAEDDMSSGPFQVSDESVTDLESMADEDSIPDILSEQDDIIGATDEQTGQTDISAESDDLILDQVDNFTPAFDNTDIKDAEYFEETDDSFDLQEAGDIEIAIGDLEDLEDVGDLGNIEDLGDVEDVEDEDINAFVAPVDSEELQQLRENGAVHMTPAPEDTSYLDEGPLSDSGADDISLEPPPEDSLPDTSDSDDSLEIQDPFEIQIEESAPEIQEEESLLSAGEEFPDEQEFDETSIALSQAALDELELSSGNSEIPPEESSLDVPDDISPDADIETNEKQVPSVPDEGDSLDQVIPEGFVVDDGETPVPFDDDLEMEEVEALEDLTDDIAPGEAFNIPSDSKGIESAEYPDTGTNLPAGIKSELKIVLSYMDQLLESLPEEKIEEFAKSEYFETYKKLFKELGLA